MRWFSPQGRRAAPWFAALVALTPASLWAQNPELCVDGPLLPGNPGNQLELCSPAPADVQVRILPSTLELSWDAPPRLASTYVSAVTAGNWQGVPVDAVVPGITVDGTYLAFRDHRIHLDVLAIDSLGVGVPVDSGVIGRDRVRIAWSSIHESTPTRATGGTFDLLPSYAGARLRFDFPRTQPGLPPDTTVLAGLRIRFRAGDPVRSLDQARFDVEDFEGWHVWRWGGDPTALTYEAVGEYSKLAGTADGPLAWPGVVPGSRRLVFVDTDVFDGFVYHYAVTTFDQGFRRSQPGDWGRKYDSPLEPAHRDGSGQLVLGPTQFRVEYRKQPPNQFVPIVAVPNPFRDSAIDPARQETQKVSFVNAPPRGTLYIFTLAGDLVFQRDHTLPAIGTIDWDTRNQSRLPVASGVYIYKIVDLVSGEQSYGRLAIIR